MIGGDWEAEVPPPLPPSEVEALTASDATRVVDGDVEQQAASPDLRSAAAVVSPTDSDKAVPSGAATSSHEAAAGGAAAGPPVPAGMARALELHNAYRARHVAGALEWSDELAARAAAWAGGCPLGVASGAAGENVGYGYPSPAMAVASWYKEVRRYPKP